MFWEFQFWEGRSHTRVESEDGRKYDKTFNKQAPGQKRKKSSAVMNQCAKKRFGKETKATVT